MEKQFLLVALDLDGTLFNSKSSISDENKKAIKTAAAAGTIFVIATGRPYNGLPLEAMKELGIQYAITTNGAAVYKVPERECLFECCMPWEEATTLVDKLLTLPIHLDLFVNGCAYTPDICKKAIESMNQLPKELKEYILSTRTMVPNLTDKIRQQKQDIQKVTLNFPADENGVPLYRNQAMNILNTYPDVYYLSGGYGNLEFTKKGISKAKGLSFLCNYLNIPIEQTIACGDSENDLDIIKAAGLGIAMSNAPEHVKEQATDIAPSNDDNGVSAIIERWILTT